MICRLFYNTKDKRYVNKADKDAHGNYKYLTPVPRDEGGTAVYQFNVQILDNCSIQDPILRLETDSNAIDANYLLLENFNRYYFIEKIDASQGYLTIYCHVDVLASFKDFILENDVILDRQTEHFDLYQHDSEYKFSERTSVRTIEFPGGFSNGAANYVLHICGRTSEEAAKKLLREVDKDEL